MKIGDMIDSKYLKQSDVEDETVVTFIKLTKVNVARDDEEADYRWTAKFQEFTKPMVLNVTNLKRAAKALGDDTDNWLGNSMILYVDPDIEFGGNIVGGLRLKGMRKTPPVMSKRPPSAVSDDDVNAELAAATGGDVPF
jgi:hypothetical protein